MKVTRTRQEELVVTFEPIGQFPDCEVLIEAIKMSYQLNLAFNYYSLKGFQNVVVMIFKGEDKAVTCMYEFYIHRENSNSRRE